MDAQQFKVLGWVVEERARQDEKWGDITHFDERNVHEWQSILTEEVGELAEAFLQRDDVAAEEEAIQVAAVAVAILESISRKSPGARD